MEREWIEIKGAHEHNLKGISVTIKRGHITVITGVSGSGKSSLAFDTILAEANRRFFYTLSHYSRQFLDLGSRPKVQSIQGLSPAIALAQNESKPSVRASVATLTEIGELLGILFAKFAEKRCPTHDLPTESQSPEALVKHLMAQYYGQHLALLLPLAEQKKGQFKKALEELRKRGASRAWIDGQWQSLNPIPELAKDEKHDIAVFIDLIRMEPAKEARLRRSLDQTLLWGEGYALIYKADAKGNLETKSKTMLSTKSGCPVCHMSWPKLDSRHFSANSLGRCASCEGRGSVQASDDAAESSDLPLMEACPSCQGTGLQAQLKSIHYRARSILRMHQMSLRELADLISDSMQRVLPEAKAELRVLTELQEHLTRMMRLGLSYLTLSRRILSLSNGEAQRLKLAHVLHSRLRGVLYVLDEPSQGLHPTEIFQINAALQQIKSDGNTILVVDHDPDIMRAADEIIDLGPGGGREGGQLLAQFAPSEAAAFAKLSHTAAYLARSPKDFVLKAPRKMADLGSFCLRGAKLHNLAIEELTLPWGAMIVISGVSGSGKTSLALGTLFRMMEQYRLNPSQQGKILSKEFGELLGLEPLRELALISRQPIAKSAVSMPATWLDVLTDLRKLYASLPEAQLMGLGAGDFSLASEGGRCPECKGRGRLILSMKFLADAEVVCPLCQGKRFQSSVLGVRYLGHHLADVLDLSLSEVLEIFQHHRNIKKRLEPAVKLGLGYLKLGQATSSLSGGESQRLKLVPYLSKKLGPGTVLVMDEPTAGLHGKDSELLLAQLQQLAAIGTTLIIIEHDRDFIAAADYVVTLGPGAGGEGGKIVWAGPSTGP